MVARHSGQQLGPDLSPPLVVRELPVVGLDGRQERLRADLGKKPQQTPVRRSPDRVGVGGVGSDHYIAAVPDRLGRHRRGLLRLVVVHAHKAAVGDHHVVATHQSDAGEVAHVVESGEVRPLQRIRVDKHDTRFPVLTRGDVEDDIWRSHPGDLQGESMAGIAVEQ